MSMPPERAEPASAAGTATSAVPGSGPLLAVEGVHVTFSQRRSRGRRRGAKAVVRAVDGVDLRLGRGEVVALAGESGCGKTTLARSIMGFVPLDAGRIVFEGEPLGKDLRAYRRQVQMVYQDPSGALNPRQTVYDSVAEGLRIHKVPGSEESSVAAALSRAGLRPPERFFLRFPHELSGGQRQRVVIAGALALEPRVIVADEPVSNLDASVRGEILRLLLELRRTSGISILIVTHDLGLAWTVADRVAVMYLGRIVELGPTRDVLTRPHHPYTRALLDVVPDTGDGPPLDRPLLAGEPPDPANIPAGCRFHPRCPALANGSAEEAGVARSCREEDLALVDVTPGHGSACHLARVVGGPIG
jgi:oligopeptide/dipeptide ABC transporter ATP-binding protein